MARRLTQTLLAGRLACAVLIGLVGVLTLGQASASGTTIVDSDPRYQRLANESLMPTPPGEVRVVEDTTMCGPGGIACTQGRTIWIRPGLVDPRTYFHELGHIFDNTVMTQQTRLRFMKIAGLPESIPWYDWTMPAAERPGEMFADAYSVCYWTGGRRLPSTWVFGGYDYYRELMVRRTCRLIGVAYRSFEVWSRQAASRRAAVSATMHLPRRPSAGPIGPQVRCRWSVRRPSPARPRAGFLVGPGQSRDPASRLEPRRESSGCDRDRGGDRRV